MGTSRPQSARPRRAERIVLTLGLASSLAMTLAALQIELRPDWVGDFALDEAARKISTAIAGEWQQLVREPDRWIEEAEEPIRWSSRNDRVEASNPPAEDLETPDSFPTFDALFAQALHREVQGGDLEGALASALAALDQPGDRERRSRAHLRCIQLARRLGRAERARRSWDRLRDEADGREAEEGVSCLLLGALTVAPLLSADERANVREELVSHWLAGDLTLPAGVTTDRDARGRLVLAAPAEVSILAEEVQGLDPVAPDERLSRALAAERARALEELLGELPVEPEDGSLGLRFLEDDVLVYRASSGGEFTGDFQTRDEVIAALETHLRSLPFFPSGFHVDLRGDQDALGTAVGPWTPLQAEALGYTLRHEDPDAFVRAEERRLGVLQTSLLGMAAFTLLAGCVSFLALRRQRVLNELKTRFVASVSHELRTPVTGILLATENLKAGRARSPERLERYHGLIHREADRLRRLVDDILDFSRIERGEETRLQLAPVALSGFATELTSEARRRVTEAGLAFEESIEVNAGEAVLDQEAIRRAVSNLVDNAIRHSGTDRIAISIRAERNLTLQIDDFGRGIPVDLRMEIFEPFRQVAADTARGTGLGLAIVREIAQAHGGTIRCMATANGPGTRFELQLPLNSPASSNGDLA